MLLIPITFFAICWLVSYWKFRQEEATLKQGHEAKIIPLTPYHIPQTGQAHVEQKTVLRVENKVKRMPLRKAR